MSTKAADFVRSYLGPTADTPPTLAVREALRHHLLVDKLKNPLDTGAQGSPRNVPGIFPDAFAVFHGVVEPEEMVGRWDAWLAYERDERGLPDGPLAEPLTHVYKCTHYTVTQHWLIGAMHPESAQRTLARQQALALRALILKDSVITKPDLEIASRALGWSAQGCELDHLATGDVAALKGAATLMAKVNAAKGVTNDVPYLWQNPNAIKDPGHQYPNCTWMDATVVDAAAYLYGVAQVDALRDLLLHGLRCLAYAQRPDGGFVDDWGWQADGSPGFHDDGKAVMDPWIWPALVAAKGALGDDWPLWAQAMLDKAKGVWAGMGRMKPGDSGFREMAMQSVAIAVAPEWGWRA